MNKFSLKSLLLKIVVVIICLFSFSTSIINPIEINKTPAKLCSNEIAFGLPSVKNILKSLFKKNNNKQIIERQQPVYVYLGGLPLGFTIDCMGVVVVAVSNESATEIKEGDIITKIEEEVVVSAESILKIINNQEFIGKDLKISFIRNGEEKVSYVKPQYDVSAGFYKLGIWVRDNAAGVGTLTYIRKDNLRFAALGHPVCDIDTGTILPTKDGGIYKCNIVACKKGEKGNPGELKGMFLRSGRVYGTLDTNNKFGVYGKFSESAIDFSEMQEIEVAKPSEVKSGKAVIRCAVEGRIPKEYEIEIVKTYFQNQKDNKSMFIRVTDKELIEKTGGIVQGMSGSPIIQNGKLVGAVTHVFVSDPTKGYGVFADYMIDF